MSHLSNALRAATAAALMGTFAFAVTATANADPAGTGSSADINTLAASLSKGYGLDNCTAQSLTSGELAALTCGQSPDPSGPVQAKYILFSNPDDLAALLQGQHQRRRPERVRGQRPVTYHLAPGQRHHQRRTVRMRDLSERRRNHLDQ